MQPRLAVIIGAGPRLGLEIGRRFGREGYRVVLASRQHESIVKLVKTLTEEGVEADAACFDAANPMAIRSGLDDVIEDWGYPDVLVYNAASGPASRPTHLEPEAILDTFRVNVVGALVAAQCIVDGMRESGRGTILFTGEGHALSPHLDAAALGMGKAALRNLAFSLAQELESDGIHVATVTITGPIAADTAFDPAMVADCFWELHTEPAGSWSPELVFHGRPR